MSDEDPGLVEAKRIGRTAFSYGAVWSAAMAVLWALQRWVFESRAALALPVITVLFLILAILGAIQWATGRGGLRERIKPFLSPWQTIALQVFIFAALLAVLWTSRRG